MAEIKYHYALDSEGNTIDISSVTDADRRLEYYCIGCGEPMRPRLGCKNAHHFAHKNDVFNCSPETYIHKLAKQKIKEWFDSDKPFQISYYQEVTCADADSCPFHKSEECHDRRLKTYALNDYYDTCSIEERVDDFIADLLLTSKKKPLASPVLIEIQVTHKSEVAKMESGYRIIEIKINSEEDINRLLESSMIKETDNASYADNQQRDNQISFTGFKRKAASALLEMRHISKFHLFKSGKAYVSNIDDFPSCRKYWKIDKESAILELAIDRDFQDDITPYEIGFVKANQLGFNVKNCHQCKYWESGYNYDSGPNFCCLYKKYNTPRNPEGPEAQTCSFYRQNSDRVKEVLDIMRNTPIVIVKQ